MKSFNKTSFAKLEKSTVKAGQTVAQNLQSLIEMALDHYVGAGAGDTEFLTRCVITAQAARSVQADAIKTYIKSHANVKWVEAEGKAPVFKKVGKGAAEITEPTVEWPEFTGQDKVKPDADLAAMLKKIAGINKWLEKSVEDDKVKESDLAAMLELSTKLKALTA